MGSNTLRNCTEKCCYHLDTVLAIRPVRALVLLHSRVVNGLLLRGQQMWEERQHYMLFLLGFFGSMLFWNNAQVFMSFPWFLMNISVHV